MVATWLHRIVLWLLMIVELTEMTAAAAAAVVVVAVAVAVAERHCFV